VGGKRSYAKSFDLARRRWIDSYKSSRACVGARGRRSWADNEAQRDSSIAEANATAGQYAFCAINAQSRGCDRRILRICSGAALRDALVEAARQSTRFRLPTGPDDRGLAGACRSATDSALVNAPGNAESVLPNDSNARVTGRLGGLSLKPRGRSTG